MCTSSLRIVNPVKVAVMAAGGIGSYLGGMLSRSGVDVTLVCRGAHLAAIRCRGLAISTPKESFSVTIAASDAPAGQVDVVLQSAKLYDLASSSRQMLPMLGPRTMVVPVQNGVTAAEEIAAITGAGGVVGGTVFINSHVAEPGVVASRSEINTLFLGELDGARSERTERFKQLCVQAGIDARIPENIQAEQWRKFIPVAALSALASLARQPIGPVREDPRLRALYRQAMQEVAALAAAKGIRLEPDIVERMLAVAERYKYDARVSMLEDLEAGKPLELDWLSGYVSREAARLGVAAPFHDMAYACLKALHR
jgi:2-dehydropantoate 2-reductase